MKAAEVTMSNPVEPLQMIAGELCELVSPQAIVRAGESLARHTTLRIGGRADLWLEPANEQDLAVCLQYAHRKSLPVMFLGRGSNLLVRGGGIRGAVVSLGQPHFSRIEVDGNHVRCGAGTRLKSVAIAARNHELSGLEFLEGIPGSVGGALRMNAGAHGRATFDAVVEVRMFDLQGGERVLAGREMRAVYRSCPTLKSHVALEAILAGQPGNRAEIEERMREFNSRRWSSQPAAPSAGCIFKNPQSMPAGKLVEELGLKGTRCGGAMVSLEHGNFIVTENGARPEDVLELIARIQERALSEYGINLETEVQIVGEEAGAGE